MHFNGTADGYNPLCGDSIQLYVDIKNGVIKDIGFQGAGCAISKASASVMSELVKGKSVEEAAELFKVFRKLLLTPVTQSVETDELGDLGAFSGVRAFPIRVKCASLAWHALEAAITGKMDHVSTE